MFAQTRFRQSLWPGPEAKAIEAWMRLSLGTRFDDTLVETVPGDLAELLEQFQG